MRTTITLDERRHWELFTGLCCDIKGPLVTDACIAASAIEHGCELVTTDSSFARFPGLRWRHPLQPRSGGPAVRRGMCDDRRLVS